MTQKKLTHLRTDSLELASHELSSVINACLAHESLSSEKIKSFVSIFRESNINDPIECMLLSQMISVHSHAMRLLAKVVSINSVSTGEAILNTANKFMKTFTSQVEAFEKLERGGHQSIKVDHVHVHEGGQAIVGNIKHPNVGGVIKNAE